EVEEQDGAKVRGGKRGASTSEPVRAHPLDVPALLPVDVQRPGRRDRAIREGSRARIGRVWRTSDSSHGTASIVRSVEAPSAGPRDAGRGAGDRGRGTSRMAPR